MNKFAGVVGITMFLVAGLIVSRQLGWDTNLSLKGDLMSDCSAQASACTAMPAGPAQDACNNALGAEGSICRQAATAQMEMMNSSSSVMDRIYFESSSSSVPGSGTDFRVTGMTGGAGSGSSSSQRTNSGSSSSFSSMPMNSSSSTPIMTSSTSSYYPMSSSSSSMMFMSSSSKAPVMLVDSGECVTATGQTSTGAAMVVTPKSPIHGQPFSIVVYFKNTGTTTWTQDYYRLMSPMTRNIFPAPIPPGNRVSMTVNNYIVPVKGKFMLSFGVGIEGGPKSGTLVTSTSHFCRKEITVQ